jgi:hypothetical protein
MNIKQLIKPVAVLAFVFAAPTLHAQILGGNAGGGLGGSLGGTLGGGMGSVGGMGQGNGTGAIGGSIDRTDALRRHTTSAVGRTRDTAGNVRDQVSNSAATIGGTTKRRGDSATSGIAGGMNSAGNASGSLSWCEQVPRMATRRAISPGHSTR